MIQLNEKNLFGQMLASPKDVGRLYRLLCIILVVPTSILGQQCPDALVHSGGVSGSRMYNAVTIASSGAFDTASANGYVASGDILLTSGFFSGEDADFSMEIEPCWKLVDNPDLLPVVVVLPDGEAESVAEGQRVLAHPNPNTGRFQIHHDLEGPGQLQIFTSSSSLIMEALYVAQTEIPVDLRTQPSGVYIIKLTTPEGVFSKRIVKR